jgi:hypothetical protein
MKERASPIIHPEGIAQHIPTGPNFPDRKNASGILIIQSENREKNIGISVSPAPLIAPW